MLEGRTLNVKLIHCGNKNIANPDDNTQKNVFYMAMGLFAIADKLDKNGHNTEILNLDLESSESINDILDLNNIDIIGFSCHWAAQSNGVIDTITVIKQINPAIFTFLGGFTGSLFSFEIMSKFPVVDGIVRGDGEIPALELCDNMVSSYREQHPDLSGVQNLVWRDENNKVICNDFSYVATSEDMNQLDFARLDLLRNWESYVERSKSLTRFMPLYRFPKFPLSIGRGCIYNCSFCGGNSKAQYRISNRKGYQIRSIESILETIKKAMSFGYKLFFTDGDFEGSDDWFVDLFSRIRQMNLSLSWGFGHYAIPSHRLIDVLADNCEHVLWELSPETGDYDLRCKNKDKRICYTNDELEDCLDYIGTKDNMKVQAFFGYCLPFETEETILKTITYMCHLFQKYEHFVEPLYLNFSTDPGALLFFDPIKYQVDLKLHSFEDYLGKMKDTYVDQDTNTLDFTAFKPMQLTDYVFAQFSFKIKLLNYLILFYRKSLKAVLRYAGDPGIVANFLNSFDFSVNDPNLITAEGLKVLLINICEENRVLTLEISNLIENEYNFFPQLDMMMRIYFRVKKDEQKFTYF